ncbi:transposase [Pedomonas sp.]|uniref:transposase n=1 Tax=Pedomonas sp. TaxID=2976421 RepID=UPI0039C99020
MKRSRFTAEQTTGVLREGWTEATIGDVCRRQGLSKTAFCKWKARYQGMEESKAKWLEALGAIMQG